MDVFFYKQKTAYEMRISDWSSDVCSSDLADPGHAGHSPPQDHDACSRGSSAFLDAAQDGDDLAVDGDLGGVELHRLKPGVRRQQRDQIGRASCRERVCQYV